MTTSRQRGTRRGLRSYAIVLITLTFAMLATGCAVGHNGSTPLVVSAGANGERQLVVAVASTSGATAAQALEVTPAAVPTAEPTPSWPTPAPRPTPRPTSTPSPTPTAVPTPDAAVIMAGVDLNNSDLLIWFWAPW